MLKLNSSSLPRHNKLPLKLSKPLHSRKQNPMLRNPRLRNPRLRKLSSPTITTSIRRAMRPRLHPLHRMRHPPSRKSRVAGSWPSS